MPRCACTPTVSIGSAPSSMLPAKSWPGWSSGSSWGIHRRRRHGSAQVGRTGRLLRVKRRWRQLGANRQLVASADLGIEPGAPTDLTLMGRRIAGDYTELRTGAFD